MSHKGCEQTDVTVEIFHKVALSDTSRHLDKNGTYGKKSCHFIHFTFTHFQEWTVFSMRFPIWLRAIKICARATWMRNFSNTSIKCDFVAPLAMNMSGGLIFPDTFENVNILNIGMPLCHPISHI